MNKKFKYLDLLFYLILLIECVSLFLSRPHFYEAARLLISIILFIYNYKGDKANIFSLYIYTGLSIVFIADILTLFYGGFLYFAGLSLFTLSYISFAAIFYRCRQIAERKKIPLNLLSLAALQFILIGLFYFVNGIADNVWIAQGILHTIVLIILMTWAFKSNKRVGINKFFLLAAILMLVANILFAIVLIQNNQYVVMRVIVVLIHGLSLLLLSKATNKYLEK